MSEAYNIFIVGSWLIRLRLNTPSACGGLRGALFISQLDKHAQLKNRGHRLSEGVIP